MSKKIFKSEIKPTEGEKPTKIDKWDWNAVKNALDDATRKFLVGQEHFKEDHKLMDYRLLISTLAVAFSAVALVYDYVNPFPKSKIVMLFCVIFYFITIGILTYYIQFIERGCSVAAKQLDEAGIDKPNRWRVYSKQKRYEANYLIEVEYENGTTGTLRKGTYEASVGKFFDENGNLVSEAFYTELAVFFQNLSQQDKKSQ